MRALASVAVLLTALLLGSAAPLAAQSAASPVPAPTPAPSPPTGVAWFGRYVGELAANTSGGFQLGDAYASEFQLGANYTFPNATATGAGIVHLILTERWGSSLTNNALGNIGSVQEIFGAGLTPRLTELDYENKSSTFDWHAGRVIMQNDFAASSTYWGGNLWCRFQNNAICGTPYGAPNNSGYGYYPASEWGAYGKIVPSKSFYAETGAFQVNPVYGQRGQGFNLSFKGTTGVDFPVEFGWLSYDRNGNYDGSIRLGGYYDTSAVVGAESNLSKFVAPTNPALAQIPSATYRGRSGGWLLVDRLIAGSSAPNARGTAIFGAYEYGDPQTAFMSNFADAGVVIHGTFPKPVNDTVSVGWYSIDVNPRLRNFEDELQRQGYAVPTNGIEQYLEVNYGIALTPEILFRPSFQYIINPAGEAGGYVYPGGAVGLHNASVIGFNATYSY
ncbi:MAG: carbohydrate porin [Candidatus Eremiobacteraeota bacterium]|nr:carbohydrate porin [Candidatus Eremiobacteraeota bacterium]